MEQEILESLMKRPGMTDKEDWIKDMISDSICEMRGFLNFEDDEDLPEGCVPAIKEIVLIRFNRDGVEGIQSESQSAGGSTTYSDTIPERVKRIILKYRKLPR